MVFAWTFPKIQHRLNGFGFGFKLWWSALKERVETDDWAQVQITNVTSPEFVLKVVELAGKFSKAIKPLSDFTNSSD